MDAREYDRIADLLMQIEKKIRNLDPSRMPTITMQSEMHYHLMSALELNDKLAKSDAACGFDGHQIEPVSN